MGFYCFPLPNTGLTPTLLESWVLNPPTPLQEIRLVTQDPEEQAIGVGFPMELGQLWQNPETEVDEHWLERYLVVRSDALAQRQKQRLNQRLEKASLALEKLAAKPWKDCCELQNKAQAILKSYRVQDFFTTTINSQVVTRYRGRGRPSVQDSSRQIHQEQFCLQFKRQDFAIDKARQLAGWRIYVSNAPTQRLS